MIRIVLALVAVVFVSACKDSDDGLTFSEEVSPGGLAFTMIRIPDSEDIAIEIAWPTDWAYHDGANQAIPAIGFRQAGRGSAAWRGYRISPPLCYHGFIRLPKRLNLPFLALCFGDDESSVPLIDPNFRYTKRPAKP